MHLGMPSGCLVHENTVTSEPSRSVSDSGTGPGLELRARDSPSRRHCGTELRKQELCILLCTQYSHSGPTQQTMYARLGCTQRMNSCRRHRPTPHLRLSANRCELVRSWRHLAPWSACYPFAHERGQRNWTWAKRREGGASRTPRRVPHEGCACSASVEHCGVGLIQLIPDTPAVTMPL